MKEEPVFKSLEIIVNFFQMLSHKCGDSAADLLCSPALHTVDIITGRESEQDIIQYWRGLFATNAIFVAKRTSSQLVTPLALQAVVLECAAYSISLHNCWYMRDEHESPGNTRFV